MSDNHNSNHLPASGTPAKVLPRLVIEYDPERRAHSHRFEVDGFDMCSLVGHLEVIQAQLVGAMMMQMQQNMMKQMAGKIQLPPPGLDVGKLRH